MALAAFGLRAFTTSPSNAHFLRQQRSVVARAPKVQSKRSINDVVRVAAMAASSRSSNSTVANTTCSWRRVSETRGARAADALAEGARGKLQQEGGDDGGADEEWQEHEEEGDEQALYIDDDGAADDDEWEEYEEAEEFVLTPESEEARAFAVAMAQACDDTKAADLLVLHVEPLVSWTSYMVRCCC